MKIIKKYCYYYYHFFLYKRVFNKKSYIKKKKTQKTKIDRKCKYMFEKNHVICMKAILFLTHSKYIILYVRIGRRVK